MTRTLSWLKDAIENIYTLLTGLFMTIVGYLIPVKNIVHLVLFFFLLDVIFGYWAANKLRKERFKVEIIWAHTMPRMLISLVLIITTYMWDSVFAQDYVSSYKFVGWFISGVLLFSIAKNGFQITKWSVFNTLGGMVKKKIEEQTDENIEGNETKTAEE